jgi:hypothetical protein
MGWPAHLVACGAELDGIAVSGAAWETTEIQQQPIQPGAWVVATLAFRMRQCTDEHADEVWCELDDFNPIRALLLGILDALAFLRMPFAAYRAHQFPDSGVTGPLEKLTQDVPLFLERGVVGQRRLCMARR